MKRLLSIGIILLFIGLSISTISGVNTNLSVRPISSGNTLYVGGSGTGNYTKIQDAIDNASDGDTIYVYDDSSPYYEFNITIDKSISLIGENRQTTVIDNNFSGTGSYINADNVTLSGFTIQNAHFFGIGIEVNSNNNTITNNIITSNESDGIKIIGHYNIISYNIISNEFDGIYCYLSKNTIIGNEIVDNHEGISVGGSFNVISRNNISGNKMGVFLAWASNVSITENNFINNRINAFFMRSLWGEFKDKLFMEFWNKIIPLRFYDPYYEPLRKNVIDGNYWNKPRTTPKPIFGSFRITERTFAWYGGVTIPINTVAFDRNPAQEPYGIEV